MSARSLITTVAEATNPAIAGTSLRSAGTSPNLSGELTMRKFAVLAFQHLTCLVLLHLTVMSQAGAAQASRISGIVRTPEGNPVAGALVTVTADSSIANARTDAAGAFRISDLAALTYALRVRLPGFVPWVQLVDVRDGGAVSIDVILRPTATLLDSVLITATRTGVFGAVGDIRTLAPLDSAIVQILGYRGADTTSNGGRFTLDRVNGGRSYVVRVSRPDYETRTVAITVPPKGGFELIAFLAPGIEGTKSNDDALWRAFESRVSYAGNSASLVTRADLGGMARSNLLTSLMQARPLFTKALRLHPDAQSDPLSPAYPCIFVNGRLASRFTLLEQFDVGEVVAVEVYGFGSLQYERLAGRLSDIHSGRIACGKLPRRQQVYEGPKDEKAGGLRAPGIKGPVVSELAGRGYIAAVVIWLRQ